MKLVSFPVVFVSLALDRAAPLTFFDISDSDFSGFFCACLAIRCRGFSGLTSSFFGAVLAFLFCRTIYFL